MSRFSKKAMLSAMHERATLLVEQHGFDLTKGVEQISDIRGREHTDRKVAYGELILYQDLANPSDGPYSKKIVIDLLTERGRQLQMQYEFNLGHGTAQLWTGRLSAKDACVAYGQMRLCRQITSWLELGSLFR